MNWMSRLTGAVALATLSVSAHATLMGEIPGTGAYSASIESSNGWTADAPTPAQLDFWTLTIEEPTQLSVSVDSSIDFGISVYFGEILADPLFFMNSGDFMDQEGGNLAYIGGTPAFPLPGSQLGPLTLLDPGVYSIALGGDVPDYLSEEGPFDYTMNVIARRVPEPGTAALVMCGLLGLFARRQGRSAA